VVRVEKSGVVKGGLVGRDLDMMYAQIASSIQKAALIAGKTPHNPEAKLRELVSPLWEEFLKKQQLTLAFEPRDEYVLANGTPDTVYNRLVLEYKKPGIIKADNDKNRVVIAKVQGYIDDLAKKEGWETKRLLGVAFDGEMFLFVRKARRWIAQTPVPVTVESVEYFLTNLAKLTGGLPLLPEYLIRDFAVGVGTENAATYAIKAFYTSIKNTRHPKVRAFFDQWALQFAEVHGSLETKKFDTDAHLKLYGFSKSEQRDFNFLAFFFALDTYYAALMKLLAYQVVGHYTMSGLVGLPLANWQQLDAASLRERLSEIEEGGVFRSLGIRNFLEGDLLSWYLNIWNNEIETAFREIIKRLNGYDPQTMELFPDETRDILKKVYQFLVPKQIRHDLGEYYTPDWLAERCLDQVGYGPDEGNLLKKRVLDPGCGSGTFLILAIKRAREHAIRNRIEPAETLDHITKNIIGFDLNPLAVISARTNYLLAIAELLKHKKYDVTIPIYLCDSINPPSAEEQADLVDVEAGHYTASTSVGSFQFPEILGKKEYIQAITPLLEDGVKTGLSTEKLLSRVETELKIEKIERKNFGRTLGETYEKLVHLEEKGINGIWARIIKNAFAPLFVGEFDFVVGNPPWVNWEDLPPSYREQTKTLWQEYGLFSLTGHEARLGGGKKDISMLMMYVAIDRYLKDKCKLCFVITQTLFKTQGAGDGFRRFRLGQNAAFFRIQQLDDLSELQPFEGATNRTSIVLCTKGERTKYPLPYLLWKKKEKGRIDVESRFDEVLDATLRRNLKAQPVGQSETSPWISAKPKALVAAKKVIGESDYTAYAGSCTWMNGVYWGRSAPS
jgi:SAM-dependent methyltransferase